MPLVVLGLLVADFAAADPQKRSKLIERLLGARNSPTSGR